MQNGQDNPNIPSKGFPNPHPQRVNLPAEELSNIENEGFIEEETTKSNSKSQSEKAKEKESEQQDFESFNLDKVDDLEESKEEKNK